MAKLPAKKPKLTPEEQLAELAALTGDVAAINLMHSPAPVPPAAPVSAPAELATPTPAVDDAVTAQAPSTSSATAAEQVTNMPPASDGVGEEQPKGKSASADVVPTLAPVPQHTIEEQPAAIATAAPAPTAETTATDDDSVPEEETAPAEVPARSAGTAYSLDALFEPSKDKKTVMMRITPALHQYFQQIGLLLGDGASVPDVVHNILLEWKTLHGQEVQKALQKQMRLMLKNAS